MVRKLLASFMIGVSLFTAAAVLFPAPIVNAASGENCKKESALLLGFPTWYKHLEPSFFDGECKLMFVESNGLIGAAPRILLAVFEIILRIAGLAAVGFIIYGGIRYIMSQGEPDQTKSAKNTIVNALVGLAISMLAVAIVNLIGNGLT